MRYLLITIALIFAVNTAKSQLIGQAKIDSLLKELPKMKEDTNGVNLLQSLSYEYYSINPDEGIKYGEKGLNIAEKIVWELGKAKCFNTLGVNYAGGKSNYSKSLEYFNKALKINKAIGNKSGIASNLGHIGIIYITKSNYPKALDYHFKSLEIFEEIGSKLEISNILASIGIIFHYQSDYPKSLEYFNKALIIFEELENRNMIATTLGNIGLVYQNQKNYEKALNYYFKALEYFEELGNKYGIATNLGNIGGVYSTQFNYEKAIEFYGRALEIFKELGHRARIAFYLGGLGELYLNLSQDSVLSKIKDGKELIGIKKELHLNKSIKYLIQSTDLLEETGALKELSHMYNILHKAYKLKGEYLKAIETMDKHILFKDSIFSQENTDKLSALEKAREDDVNRLKIEKQEILLKAKEDEKQLILISAGGALLAVLIILTLIINQRRKSEKLLLNILPATIAKRLKAKEENIADDFEKATTVFIDLVGFTSFAKDKKASEVVKLLNNIFHKFDDLVKKHGLEKIKTMGDGYLAVAGVPDPDNNHCQKAIDFALDVRKELEKFNEEMGLEINARIGLESGPLVAGVIGSSKFIYDIWGDSVNTASRMESTGTPGKIQITENVKSELEKHATDLQFEKREAFEVKGKGLMQTYYLE